jgi:hypothetical protein
MIGKVIAVGKGGRFCARSESAAKLTEISGRLRKEA